MPALFFVLKYVAMLTHIKQIIALLLLLTAGWLIHENGLTGGFMFDDANNLSRLSTIDNEISLKHLKTYFGESTSGPLKRPISVFSFLIDAQDWPAEAYSFKRTNVIIHLINGALLFILFLALFKSKGINSNQTLLIATLGCAMWLFHPFLVSTTLYVVQRMAMLPLTFMLLGFCLFVWGREKYHLSDGVKGRLMLFTAVYLMTLLAMLSKENGVIFLWLVALFEWFIIQRYLIFKPMSRQMSLWLLKIPGLALFILLLLQLPAFIADYDLRIFSMGERLLSQTRAITKYIYHLFIPSYFTEGVFTDGFKQSHSLFNPISTLFSTALIILLLAVAWVKRNTWVWFSFVVFFFFIAQVLESTIVPLELYFEHRVYVASIFISVPIVLLFIKLSQQSTIYLMIPVIICLILAGFTFMRSNIWGNNLQLFELTMNKFPESVRARMSAAAYYERNGQVDEALLYVNEGMEMHDNLEYKFNQLAVYCVRENMEMSHMDDLYEAIGIQYFTKHDHRPFINLVRVMFKYNCLGEKTYQSIFDLAEAMQKNPNTKIRQKTATTNYIKAQVYFAQAKYALAEQMYMASFAVTKDEYEAMHTAIVQFINIGEFQHAENILDYESQLYQQNFKYKIDWLAIGDTIDGFRELINKSINEQQINNNPTSKERSKKPD